MSSSFPTFQMNEFTNEKVLEYTIVYIARANLHTDVAKQTPPKRLKMMVKLTFGLDRGRHRVDQPW